MKDIKFEDEGYKKRLTAATVNPKENICVDIFINNINYLVIIKQEKVHICRNQMIKLLYK